MTPDAFRFELQPDVSLSEAEMSLHLALFAVEGLFGEARVRLEASYRLDAPCRSLIVEGSPEVGAAVARVFTRLLAREFGEDAFRVRRINEPMAPVAGTATARCEQPLPQRTTT